MVAKIVEDGTSVYSGTGFSAVAIAVLPAGSQISVIASKRIGGKRWFSVTLADGQAGWLPGEAKFSSADGSDLSAWRGSEQREAGRQILFGAAWMVAGAAAIAFMIITIRSAVESHESVEFPFKPVALASIVAVLYGLFRLVGGLVEYFQSFRD